MASEICFLDDVDDNKDDKEDNDRCEDALDPFDSGVADRDGGGDGSSTTGQISEVEGPNVDDARKQWHLTEQLQSQQQEISELKRNRQEVIDNLQGKHQEEIDNLKKSQDETMDGFRKKQDDLEVPINGSRDIKVVC
ncbi:hypothetical protein E2562_024850 [Oryza meyeriana var. granulata]|uniref:Uncharacterized protein n=1 Tax=Oryza meyeriana var. granulata TaxID=110450 RepID=A0A6G1CI47_9ORYZ|nr:hypothetical protein E2562_024850 [Oryza meyeriana var. granulata]